MTPHLVVDISGHGYGHAGMTVPILNELKRTLPALQLTIRTTVPLAWLKERIEGSFDYTLEPDFGMAMTDALHVSPTDTLLTYSAIHSKWEESVHKAAERLRALKPSLLLSNIPYLSLAAANQTNIPSVALSSLNWADIFKHYCGHLPDAAGIWRQMMVSYASATFFLQLTPAMSMPSIRNGRKVGPVALIGDERKTELRHRLKIAGDKSVVLVALGGIPIELPIASWPRLDDLFVILASKLHVPHAEVITADTLDFQFIDLLRSCDVLISKAGYGTVTEAACNAIPTLLVPREGWPEETPLRDWLAQHGRTLMLSEEQLRMGHFSAAVHAVRSLPAPSPPRPTGITEVATILSKLLPE